MIRNSFTISAVQPSGTISASLTQNVILVDNKSPTAPTFTLPSAGPGTAGKDLAIVLTDFSLSNGNSINLTAGAGDQIVIGSATVCASGCTNTSFPVNIWVHVVSDGNHHWYCPANN